MFIRNSILTILYQIKIIVELWKQSLFILFYETPYSDPRPFNNMVSFLKSVESVNINHINEQAVISTSDRRYPPQGLLSHDCALVGKTYTTRFEKGKGNLFK
jgi:hypothetical protein